ncbi:MAG: phosphoribose diphosphate:decaprenyl-phosphate phosphoribosyltransferase [Candidatus Magasanikbacteria bacterium GW2011_GWC2_41_17]|uniref:Phosphoribose diphosphate:decaprenyl-phosphate phosphoribosyltransferase n=2 Tax=Candidatus Magasanikiibacteriota TaxID=1752731 RepID=A0A0G0WNN3_9BACT|nr:MAG: phosphoribose diphosphate:decaprenyl-phosphate phosphoribosyltransferase [Candidatus Magasanikbacteria bacterium GW2011_GWC2_41_17]KKS13677.1 MAG: phosphoribose diphosphate:decaprenyl-phosphate phosphoribosyltransferase [Candidatus Magasanikbacteria bacterium GW2011_GWA2_41_55]
MARHEKVMFLKYLFISLRPRHWIKNFFVFAALIFAKKFTDWQAIRLSLFAFALFCLASSGIYLINDVIDFKRDQEHPSKKNRPIASGKISRLAVSVLGILLLSAALLISWELSLVFFWTIAVYIFLNLAYSFWLKRVVIVDIICIAIGFVLRVIAGVVVIGVIFSPWLLLCTFFLTLFLAIGKRKSELLSAVSIARGVLANYSLDLLNQMNMIVLPAILITYTLYTFNTWQSQWLITTVPIVSYGLFRYLYVINKKSASDDGPTDDLWRDRPLQITLVVWLTMVFVILINV